MTLITKQAARRIWQEMKRTRMNYGFCLFDKNGNGGAWYSENTVPPMEPTDIKWHCDHDLVYGTFNEFYDEVYRFLEQREQDRQCEAAFQSEFESDT